MSLPPVSPIAAATALIWSMVSPCFMSSSILSSDILKPVSTSFFDDVVERTGPEADEVADAARLDEPCSKVHGEAEAEDAELVGTGGGGPEYNAWTHHTRPRPDPGQPMNVLMGEGVEVELRLYFSSCGAPQAEGVGLGLRLRLRRLLGLRLRRRRAGVGADEVVVVAVGLAPAAP